MGEAEPPEQRTTNVRGPMTSGRLGNSGYGVKSRKDRSGVHSLDLHRAGKQMTAIMTGLSSVRACGEYRGHCPGNRGGDGREIARSGFSLGCCVGLRTRPVGENRA